MSARNFYIMQSAVAPMQSETPCYTPLTNHRTEVHTVPLVMASDYNALEAECERLRQFQIAYNDWQAKTDWVQESAKPNELGRHRADVLRARIEALAAELAHVRTALAMHDRIEKDTYAQCVMLREALTMFVHLAESRLRELGSLSPEMAKCLNRGRDALATSAGQEVEK